MCVIGACIVGNAQTKTKKTLTSGLLFSEAYSNIFINVEIC